MKRYIYGEMIDHFYGFSTRNRLRNRARFCLRLKPATIVGRIKKWNQSLSQSFLIEHLKKHRDWVSCSRPDSISNRVVVAMVFHGNFLCRSLSKAAYTRTPRHTQRAHTHTHTQCATMAKQPQQFQHPASAAM